MSLEDVGMQYSHPVMFHSFPVVRRENMAVNTKDHNYITMLLEDVGMQYSLPIMFHSFPVVWRENTAVNSKDH